MSTHAYPTDSCNPSARTDPDCFTSSLIDGRRQASGHEFLITEYNCGWKDDQIHDGESHAYGAR